MAQRDRRRFLRVPAEFSVSCRRIDAEGKAGARFRATTVNVSAGGVMMRAAAELDAGERLRLEIRLSPPPFLVFAEATVVRVEDREAGRTVCAARFDGLDRYVEQRIVRFTYAMDRRAADRRLAARVPLQVIVTCRARGRRFRAGTIDVAADGARIVTDRRVPDGERVELELELDDPPYARQLRGRVVWSRDDAGGRFIHGLRFEGLDAHAGRELVEHAAAAEERGRAGA